MGIGGNSSSALGKSSCATGVCSVAEVQLGGFFPGHVNAVLGDGGGNHLLKSCIRTLEESNLDRKQWQGWGLSLRFNPSLGLPAEPDPSCGLAERPPEDTSPKGGQPLPGAIQRSDVSMRTMSCRCSGLGGRPVQGWCFFSPSPFPGRSRVGSPHLNVGLLVFSGER